MVPYYPSGQSPLSNDKTIRIEKSLPQSGWFTVEVGQEVVPGQDLARTAAPTVTALVDVAGRLGLPPDKVKDNLTKAVGSKLAKGEAIAATKGMFRRKTVASPIEGILAYYDPNTGFARITSTTRETAITSSVAGRVSLLSGSDAVTVEMTGTRVYGIAGLGGEARGKLLVLEAGGDIEQDMITGDCTGYVLLGRYGITEDALKQAVEVKVSGLILGSISLPILQSLEPTANLYSVNLRKWEPFSAVNSPMPIVVTEGIGRIRMPDSKYALFESRDGSDLYIDGRTRLRGGLQRPQIIFPKQSPDEQEEELEETVADEPIVWLNCAPYIGREGRIIKLPDAPLALETGSRVRAAEVAMDNTELAVPVNDIELGESL